MDRTEWLACGSPQAMLEFLQGPMSPNMRRMDAPWEHPVSDRKLRLFFEAAGCDLCHVSGMSPAEQAVYVAGASCGTQAGKAALLREIVGDPFAPGWVVGSEWSAEHERLRPGVFEPKKQVLLRRWLTPTVLSLAQAAYDERGRRDCGPCGGVGQRHQTKQLSGERAWMVCPDCRGAGRVEDGTLDPVRLLVLADALEEAGCDSEPLLRHLRGEEPQYVNTGPGGYGDEYGWLWRPLRGPHVRGCWALDLILGKS